MKVVADNHYSGSHQEFEGPEDSVREQLLAAYPWLLVRYGRRASVYLLVSALDGSQAISAHLDAQDVMFKAEQVDARPFSDRCLAAAAFLSGKDPDMALWRQGMVEHGEDAEVAALVSCGLLDGDQQGALESLRAVMSIKQFQKATSEKLPTVNPLTLSARPTADMANRAAAADRAHPIKLGGKHSDGAFLCVDPETGTRVLLKPGSGPPSPADGVAEVHVSQSKREAAFSEAAWNVFHLSVVPEAYLVQFGGREAAAIHMTDPGFDSSDLVKKMDPAGYRRSMLMHLRSGDLFRWAAMDWILGNPDRHAGNVLMMKGDVALIDHGSALAGPDFAPGHDKSSFIPAYLRFAAPQDFDQRDDAGKIQGLPRVSDAEAAILRGYLLSLDMVKLVKALERYGIDSDPSRARFNQLVHLTTRLPADLAINTLWVRS